MHATSASSCPLETACQVAGLQDPCYLSLCEGGHCRPCDPGGPQPSLPNTAALAKACSKRRSCTKAYPGNVVAAKSNAGQEPAKQLASGFPNLMQDLTSATNGQSWHFWTKLMTPGAYTDVRNGHDFVQVLLPARHEKGRWWHAPVSQSCSPVSQSCFWMDQKSLYYFKLGKSKEE